MKFPFLSTLTAVTILGLSTIILAYIFLQESKILQTSIEVDASIIDEVSRQAEKKSLADDIAEKKPSQNVASANSGTNKVATIISRPLPEIPQDLRQEAFNSYAIARFYIKSDGSFEVELIKPCANPRLNYLLLKSLKKWQFSAVESAQDIRVNFKVE